MRTTTKRRRRPRRPAPWAAGPDLFDHPPWPLVGPERRSRWESFARLAVALSLSMLSLLGLVVVGLVALVVAVSHFSVGSLDLGSSSAPASYYAMDVVVSTDGSTAYVTEPSADRLVVLDNRTGALQATVPVGTEPTGLALSPDGSQVWVVNTAYPGDGNGSVTVISTATDTVLGTVVVGSDPIDVAFAPDGATAYVTDNAGGTPGSVTVVDTATRLVRATLTLPVSTSPGPFGADNPTSIAVSPDGQEIWISSVDDFGPLDGSNGGPPDGGLVTVFSALTGTPMATVAVDAGPFFLALSPDGRFAYVAAKSGCAVQEIDTATFAIVGTVHWPTSSGCPYGLATSPTDGVVYAVSGADAIFDEPVGHAFGQVDFAFGAVSLHPVGANPVTLALSPDGTTADVVDAGAPRILVVDTANGAVTTSWAVPPASPPVTAPTASIPTAPALAPGTTPAVSEPRLSEVRPGTVPVSTASNLGKRRPRCSCPAARVEA